MRVGVSAADVIALQQNLIATAHAHQTVAELVEAGIGVGAQKGEGQQRDQQELGDAKFSNAKFRVSSFEFQDMSTKCCLEGARL